MAIDTDTPQESLIPVPQGQEEGRARRRSDRKSKQAAKATRRPRGKATPSVESSESTEKPSTRRGRSPKQAEVEPTTRRKPGRPPKARVTEIPPPPPAVPEYAELEDLEVAAVLTPPPPPPPQTVAEPVEVIVPEVSVAEPVLPPRRGPGRPRKTPVVGIPVPPAAPPKPVLAPVMPEPEPGNRLDEMSVHAVGFFKALFNLGAAGEQAKPAEIEILTTKDVARIVQARESEVVAAIHNGQLRATQIGKGYRTTPHNVKVWLEG